MERWLEVCRRCGWMGRIGTAGWRCQCGGLLDLQRLAGGGGTDFATQPEVDSLWRYAARLSFVSPVGSMGEGWTRLEQAGDGVWVKCDHEMPTGSFKDRGASVMVSLAAWLDVKRVVADSSGNAGRAVAAYAAQADLVATVYVPAGTADEKVAAISSYGAFVVVGGDRSGAAAAAQQAVEAGEGWYASHVYQPSFVHGVKTLAFELWEQLGGQAPAAVVVPAGNGTLVMGLWLGFRELGVAVLPRLVAVQAAQCAPLAGLAPAGPTAATGIAIASPPRAGEVLAAIRASRGGVVTVSEAEISAAGEALAARGLRVEPSAAAAWAGWEAGRVGGGGGGAGGGAGGAGGGAGAGAAPVGGPVVVVLTGAGR